MTKRLRTSLRMSVTGPPPRVELYLSSEELAAAAGISPTALARLIRLGVVEPPAPMLTEGGPRVELFPAAVGARLRRMQRLHADLGVNFTGAAIIVDLLARLERLEAELENRAAGRQ